MIALPPEDAVNQPLKLYPARVGVPGSVIAPPVVVEIEVIALPPCVFRVTVSVLTFHTGVRFTLDDPTV